MSKNKKVLFGFPLLLLGLFVLLSSQKSQKPIVEQGHVVLSEGKFTDSISVEHFLINMGKPIMVVDDDNNKHPVTSFRFSYAERGMYEDESGKPFIDAEYLVGYYDGGKLDTPMVLEMFRRAKPGDTAYIEEVKYLMPSKTKGVKSSVYKSKPLKLFLTR